MCIHNVLYNVNLEDWLSAVFLFTSLFSHQRLQNLYSLVAFFFGVIAIWQVKCCPTLLGKFFDWRPKKSIFVLLSGKLGTAFQYCLNRMDKFMNTLKDGRLELSNNRAERAVKEIIMWRKNWLFSQSSTGAKAMAIIMSILETTKQNGLDQFKYINYAWC